MGGDASAGEYRTITTVHKDIIQTQILARLDGETLASAGCASAQLRALSADEKLWQDICNRTWPSTADPRVSQLISTFSAGHWSFYSDSFPTIYHGSPSQTNCHRHRLPLTSKLISAVDIRYQDKLIYSKVKETEAGDGFPLTKPFRIELIDPKETVPVPMKFDNRDELYDSDLEKNLTLTWILIDPTQKRAANISSLRPVLSDRDWFTGDVELFYVTVVAGDRKGELVQCVVVVKCEAREGGDLQVREVSLQVEDMEGKKLSCKESLAILQEAMEKGKRRKGKGGEERKRYGEYLKLRRERRERKQRRETRVELLFFAYCFTIFVLLVIKFFSLLLLN